MEEKRKLKRSLCYLKAIKEETGEHIGHVGLNLISENELSLHDDLTICVETLEEEVKIALVIKGVWNQMNEEPKHYTTGCQVINPSSETVDAIYRLIESLKKGGRNPFKMTSKRGSA